MFDKKINLPTEIIQELAITFLDPKSILSASKVSKSWNSLFTHPTIWKTKLTQDFGIDSRLLSKLSIPKENQFLYKEMYTQADILARHCHLPGFIKTIFQHKTSYYLLFLACLDNTTAFENVTVDEQYSLVVLSIYIGGFHIPVHFLHNNFLQNQKRLLQSLLNHSLMSGNFQLVQYLVNPANQFGLKPDQETLGYAALSGKIQLVQYLLNPANHFSLKPDQNTIKDAAESGNLEVMQYFLNLELKPDQDTLQSAAKSGNLKLVQYLLNSENQFALELDQRVLNCAARSGNLQLVQHLLNPENQFPLELDHYMLNCAAKSGNLQLVRYLLNPKNQFGLKPNQYIINDAALSGSLQLVQYLLNTKNLGLKPNQYIINDAALSGSLQLVQYLLNSKNQFGLKPDQIILDNAADSGNLELVQFLLNPANQFGLTPNQDTITKVNQSRNFGLSEHLLPSHIAMHDALQKLQAGDFDLAKELLQKSHTASPSHYKLLSDYFLKNAKLFNLNDVGHSIAGRSGK